MEPSRFVTVIIPSKRGALLSHCLVSLEKQTYPRGMFELIVVSCEECGAENTFSARVRIVINNEANQAEARNIAEKLAKGNVLAFCDDDCILPPEWIENAVCHFADREVSTVGGPSIPPTNGVTFREVLSGLLMMSFLGTGSHRKAYTSDSETKPRLCGTVDIICANMFVDRVKFCEVGGFDGIVPQEEDRLNKKFLDRGYKLIYDPRSYNIHHQRPWGLKAIKNIFWLMAGQGSLTMERHKPSSLGYLIPPLFAIGFIVGPFLFELGLLRCLYIILVGVYAISAVAETLRLLLRNKSELDRIQSIKTFVLMPFIFLIHHIVSGVGFLYGFFRQLTTTKKNKS